VWEGRKWLFWVNFFSFKSAWIFACAFQLSNKPFPCIFFGLVCTLFLRKTKTKYRSMHNEHNIAKQEHFSQKEIQENDFLLNWKHMQKFRHFWRKQFYPTKSLTSFLHQAIQLLISVIFQPKEKGNKRPHHLANVRSALKFLTTKNVSYEGESDLLEVFFSKYSFLVTAPNKPIK